MRKVIGTASALALVASMSATPSFAAGVPASAPSGDTSTAAQGVCNDDLATLQNDEGDWSTRLVFGTSPTATDPVEVSDTRVETSAQPDLLSAVISFSDVSAVGSTDLTRNGQSPNIFAKDARARTVTYANHSYDFTAQFTTTTSFSYDCEMTKLVHTTTTTPGTPAGPVQGFYTNPGNGDCQGVPNTNPNWGQDLGQGCIFTKTGDGTPAIPGTSVTTSAPVRQAASDTSHTIPQDDTASGTGTELNGGQRTFTNQSLKVMAVVCNSPTKNPGTWRAQNGYDGGLCSYATFTSLGTPTIPSNSLPTT